MHNLRPAIAEWLIDVAADAVIQVGPTVADMRRTSDDFVVSHHRHVRTVTIHEVRDLTSPGGVPVKLYLPTPDSAPEVGGSLHVHLHGGGWWMGSSRTVEPMSRELAASLGVAVASIDYALAPESPWPAGADDVYEALTWLSSSYDRVTLGGESAGANLAAVVALMARDRRGPAISALWLDVPLVDFVVDPEQESIRLYGTGFGVEAAHLPMMTDWYLGTEESRDLTHPYASPAYADLAGLPPTIVTTAECDPLRDQGEAFAAALAAAGVAVELRRNEGHLHGSAWLTAIDAGTAEQYDETVAKLAAFHRVDEPALVS